MGLYLGVDMGLVLRVRLECRCLFSTVLLFLCLLMQKYDYLPLSVGFLRMKSLEQGMADLKGCCTRGRSYWGPALGQSYCCGKLPNLAVNFSS